MGFLWDYHTWLGMQHQQGNVGLVYVLVFCQSVGFGKTDGVGQVCRYMYTMQERERTRRRPLCILIVQNCQRELRAMSQIQLLKQLITIILIMHYERRPSVSAWFSISIRLYSAQSSMSSAHSLCGLPLLLLPSIAPNITVLVHSNN